MLAKKRALRLSNRQKFGLQNMIKIINNLGSVYFCSQSGGYWPQGQWPIAHKIIAPGLWVHRAGAMSLVQYVFRQDA